MEEVRIIDLKQWRNENLERNLIQKKKKSKVIVSHHDFERTPNNLKNIFDRIKKINHMYIWKKLIKFLIKNYN